MIQEMKKQILAYRQEIIELSTCKKHSNHRVGSDMENMRIPKLDLSKVKRDSDEDDDSDSNNDG